MSLLEKKFPWTIMCDNCSYNIFLFTAGFFRAFAMLLYVVPLQESNSAFSVSQTCLILKLLPSPPVFLSRERETFKWYWVRIERQLGISIRTINVSNLESLC